MKCRCGSATGMEFLWRWDDAQETDHCFNVYGCGDCGRVAKVDVWKDEGQTWLNLTGVEGVPMLRFEHPTTTFNVERCRHGKIRVAYPVPSQPCGDCDDERAGARGA